MKKAKVLLICPNLKGKKDTINRVQPSLGLMLIAQKLIDDGHIGIREMKPPVKIENIEDEMSKVFRLHQKGIFNEFIKREDLLDMLQDILGENIDCFLSQFIFRYFLSDKN